MYDYSKTNLHYAQTLDNVRWLLKAGADVNALDITDQTPLFTVKDIACFDALIKAGADVNSLDMNGNTPLHYARTYAHCKLLIEAGAYVNSKNDSGYTPLHCIDDVACIKLLVESGADIEARNDYGCTPLFNRRVDVTRCLIELGANVNARCNRDLNAMEANTLYESRVELFMAGSDVRDKRLIIHFLTLMLQ